MVKGIIIGFFCFFCFLGHIFIFHKFDIKRRFYAMVKVFFCGLFIYLLLFSLISESQAQNFVTLFLPLTFLSFLFGAFLHFCFFYVYLYFIQIVDRTPTARIMIEIEKSPEKRLSLKQLSQLYSIENKIIEELNDLVILGCLQKENSFYAITPKGKRQMVIFRAFRDYLRLKNELTSS